MNMKNLFYATFYIVHIALKVNKTKYFTMYVQEYLLEFSMNFGYKSSTVCFLQCFANVFNERQPPVFKPASI